MATLLYVHIPFCDHICAYCDFARVLNKPDLVDEYLDVLQLELSQKEISDLETLYIGGGTPSALTTDQLRRLFEMLKPYTQNIKEYTIEINPESLTLDKAKVFVEYNLNRASLGMQVTQAHLLELIDRKHDLNKTREAVEILKSVGITNISIDLMYGIPTQTIENLKESLSEIVALDVPHVSLYALTVEPNSKFGHLGYKEADRELDANMYEYAVEYLSQSKLHRYEVSNFARENKQSMHNKVYWHYDDFIGVGLHASGKENHVRYTNTRNLRKYLNQEFREEEEKLSKRDEMFEYLMMNLRLSDGFKVQHFNSLFNKNFKEVYTSEIDKLVSEGLLLVDDETVKTTDKGMELLFNVLEEFMD